jgi:hypothetical protein
MAKRDRSTIDGDQSSSGVGGDDRDRQGERVQDPESPRARGQKRAGAGRSRASTKRRRTGSRPRLDKSGRGSRIDTGNRRGRGEKATGERTRSGSRSNAS